MATHRVVLIPGDGIGPEVTAAVTRIMEAACAPIQWVERRAGLAALEGGQDVLPQETLDAITQHKVALKGPCTTPVGKGFASINVQLRKRLNLYAAVRPVRNLAGVPTRFTGVDLVVVRENTEGLYSGIESEVTAGVVTSLKVATKTACERIARWAFAYASRRGRREVTELIIDAGCMRLVQDPARFDVLLMENLYGDVVSDLCAGMVGGLGIVPGANIGDDGAIFEAVHGSAPDIAGQGIANPLALLMSGVMMLNHLADTRGDAACRRVAQRIKEAYNRALADGKKTRDLGGDLSTDVFAQAVIERLPA
ncbi:MAG: isocitrate/isopropylmalate family dehydrogenase [candidate division NC10 bacterium]|nr:isocitrate/isopropylmalate family dehydrogenase [candidate division NC10 bacterium]